jgi:protein SCO1
MLMFTATWAQAGLTVATLDELAFAPPADARLPMQSQWQNEQGSNVRLGEAMGDHPALIIFADFTCRTLCGPILTLAVDALAQSRLLPGTDYRLIVLGLDANDGPAEARKMQREQIPEPAIASASVFLSADETTIRNTAAAVGYRFAYDAERDQFAHPAAVLVAAADGRITRMLSGLAMTPDDLRLALVEAGEGQVGNLGDRLRLLCYGFDPAVGAYTPVIYRALAALSAVTVVVVALMMGAMSWRPQRIS